MTLFESTKDKGKKIAVNLQTWGFAFFVFFSSSN